MTNDLAFRDALPVDQPWLAALYADTRHEEVTAFGWDTHTEGAFLMQQFDLQQRGYQATHPQARCQIVELVAMPADGERRIGRLWVDEHADELRLLDIRLRRGWRGRGLGTRLIHQTMGRAASTGRPIGLHVEESSPARRLYERLGFTVTDHQPPYLAMEWRVTEACTSLRVEVCDEQA